MVRRFAAAVPAARRKAPNGWSDPAELAASLRPPLRAIASTPLHSFCARVRGFARQPLRCDRESPAMTRRLWPWTERSGRAARPGAEAPPPPAQPTLPTAHALGHFYSPIVNPGEARADAARLWPAQSEPVLGVDFDDAYHAFVLGTLFREVLSRCSTIRRKAPPTRNCRRSTWQLAIQLARCARAVRAVSSTGGPGASSKSARVTRRC